MPRVAKHSQNHTDVEHSMQFRLYMAAGPVKHISQQQTATNVPQIHSSIDTQQCHGGRTGNCSLPRKATIAKRPCLISAVFRRKALESSALARPRGSKAPPVHSHHKPHIMHHSSGYHRVSQRVSQVSAHMQSCRCDAVLQGNTGGGCSSTKGACSH